MSSPSARPYEEPTVIEILVLASFLIFSNLIDSVLNRLLCCGLVGQILIGVAWGTPGGNFLPESIQDAVTQFGYLGLIMIVYEGGLATDLKALRGDLALSLLVALIGTTVPIALSFTLQGFLDISALQAFAAGASLCSTSLGTTFTVLSASGLDESRLGIVLTSAAMIDDVVGLIVSGVISSLGSSSSSFSAVTVIRPVFVSLAFAVLLPVICAFIVKPLAEYAVRPTTITKDGRLAMVLKQEGAAVCFYALLLIGFVTSASYAGTSELFAAYLAGVATTWLDDVVGACSKPVTSAAQAPSALEEPVFSTSTSETQPTNAQKLGRQEAQDKIPTSIPREDRLPAVKRHQQTSGHSIYKKYFGPATDYVLRPFFFASIGFAIPISKLFSGNVLWRGVVYSVLMFLAKLVCGLALTRFPLPSLPRRWLKRPATLLDFRGCWPSAARTECQLPVPQSSTTADGTYSAAKEQLPPSQDQAPARSSHTSSRAPRSLYPAALLGSAMVARGEIGFLISSIAEADGIFDQGDKTGNSDVFLVTTWAILICTFLGPITVGILVRRVHRLQTEERRRRTGKGDPLGAWGIRSH